MSKQQISDGGYLPMDRAFFYLKNMEKIALYMTICRKENEQRNPNKALANEMGVVEFSSRTLAEDMKQWYKVDKEHGIVANWVKEFVKLGLLEPVYKSKSSAKASVYRIPVTYSLGKRGSFIDRIAEKIVTVNVTVDDDENVTVDEHDKVSNINALEVIGTDGIVTVENDENVTVNVTSYINKDIVVVDSREKTDLEENIKLKQQFNSYGIRVSDNQSKLLGTMNKELIEQALDETVAQNGKTFSYFHKVYKSLKDKPKEPKPKEPKAKPKPKAYKSKQTSAHNIPAQKVFDRFTPEQLEQHIQENQKRETENINTINTNNTISILDRLKSH